MDSNGCFAWFLAFVIWFSICGVAFSCDMNPLVLLLLIVVGIILLAIVVFLVVVICNWISAIIYEKYAKQVTELEKEYPFAYKKYLESNHIQGNLKSGSIPVSSLKNMRSRDKSIWEKEEKVIIEQRERQVRELKEKADRIKTNYQTGFDIWSKGRSYLSDELIVYNEKRIRQFDEAAKDVNWEHSQSIFASTCRDYAKNNLSDFGCYKYTIEIPGITQEGEPTTIHLPVWQHFICGVCLEKDLDYSYNKNVQKNTEDLPRLKKEGIALRNESIVQIEKYITQLAANRKLLVFFNEEIEGWTSLALTLSYTIVTPDNVREINAAIDKALDIESKSGKELLAQESPDCVLIIDAFTTNEQLKKNCEYVFATLHNQRPNIAYLSLIKAYDREEMVNYIQESKAQAERFKEEELRKETERKKEEERIAIEKKLPSLLNEKVKNWIPLNSFFRYMSMLNYYPTSCSFEISDNEWDDRWLVWNFKNDPDRNISAEEHELAMGKVVQELQIRLLETFGDECLPFLTLVCLPASTKAKHEARYEEFSKRICEKTGMQNGYPHIKILADGLSKKDPQNSTGKSTAPKVVIDDWFKGKNVILFDDVITSGNTMLIYKKLLERKGANVVAGMAIGKTKHERPE